MTAVSNLLLALLLGAQAGDARAPVELQRGSSIELPFGPASSQEARIHLDRGESADIRVNQQGVDVVVQVRAPDGTLLDEVDSPNGRNGDEPVSILARKSGNFVLAIRPISASEPQGRITINVAELRNTAETARLLQHRRQLRDAASQWLRQSDFALPHLDRIPSADALEPFDRIARSARVVGLGEATHGSREFGDARLALVQRLVEKFGYRLIALEDGVGRWRALEPYVAGTSPNPATAVEWGWIGRRSRAQLLQWVRTWNLRHPNDRVRVVGVDPQDNAVARGALGQLLERAYGERVRDLWRKAATELAAADEQTQVFGDSGVDPEVAGFLRETLMRLETDAPIVEPKLGAADYALAVDYARELAAFADFNSGGSALGRSRDWYMALGLLRALRSSGGSAKGIYWGHNAHVAVAGTNTAGAILRGALGCNYRAVATTFGRGSFLAQMPNDLTDRLFVTVLPPATDESVESVLAKVRPGAHLASWDCPTDVAAAPEWLRDPQPMHWVGGIYTPGTIASGSFRPYRLLTAFDAILYFPIVSAEADPGDRPLVAARKR